MAASDACTVCRTYLICPRHCPTETERKRAEALQALYRATDERDWAYFEESEEYLVQAHGVQSTDELPMPVRREYARCVHKMLNGCASGARAE